MNAEWLHDWLKPRLANRLPVCLSTPALSCTIHTRSQTFAKGFRRLFR